MHATLTEGDISRIVAMAWGDRTAFEAVVRMWRKSMAGRATKHTAALYCSDACRAKKTRNKAP